MIRSFLSSFRNWVKSFSSCVCSLPSSIKKQFFAIKKEFGNLYYKLNNLASSNLDLGIYHLYNRNYSDAILRFKMIDKFLDPNNKTANYWLGWAYFLKGEHKKSIIALTKSGKEDKVKLLDFVKSIDKTQNVPIEIYKIHRDIISSLFLDRFINETVNLPQQMVLQIIDGVNRLPKEYKILELGSNVGLLSAELRKRMQDKMHLTSLESSGVMAKLQKEIFSKQKIYNELIEDSVDGFLKTNKKKYDIICSLNGLAFTGDLSKIFTLVSKSLKASGYFAFAVKSHKKKTRLDQDLEFLYEHQALMGQLEKAGFQILSSDQISLEIKNNYSIFVCIKSK